MEHRINRYKELLWTENARQNLVSRRINKEDLEEHIADSRALLDFIEINKETILDIGSGAGLPGLILACYLPENHITLVESDQKKCGFLTRTALELNLEYLEVVNQRAEVLGQNPLYREQYDVCTSRAVAELRVVTEYGIPLLKEGGLLVAWKGVNYREEIDRAQKALELLQTEVINICEYNCPANKKRFLVVMEKKKATLKQFPRRTGIPAKRPL